MRHQTIADLLRAHARRSPERPFLTSGVDRFTFGELDAQTDRVAAGLYAYGVRPGDRVAMLSPNRTEVLELYFALAKVGAVQVPLNAYLKGEFLRHQLADSAATVLVADQAGIAAALPLLDQLPELARIVALDEPVASPSSSRQTSRYQHLRESDTAPPEIELNPADLMSIVYTSGTTGFPKGCMLPHGYYLRTGRVMADAMDIDDNDVLITALPLFHGAARMMCLAAGLLRGVQVVIEPEFRASTFLQRATDVGATLALGVGAMGSALLAQPPGPVDRAHRLRAFLLIPFPAARQQQFRERFGVDAWAELFGQTECVPITWNGLTSERAPDSCGKPGNDLDVVLLDDDDRQVATGQVGEICLRPHQPFAMFAGYWRNPDATLDAQSTLWYHTGDYGRSDENGCIHFVDRKKDAVRRRGENVSTLELEIAITAHPKIAEAAAHAVPSEATEDDIKVCLVLQPGNDLDPEELFTFFRETLPYFALPRYVEIVDELPKNAVGRVMKFQLRQRTSTDQVWDLDQLRLSVQRAERR